MAQIDEDDLFWQEVAIRSIAEEGALEDARELIREDLAKDIFKDNEEINLTNENRNG